MREEVTARPLPADRPGKAAVAEWNQMYRALLAHENGHKKIYLDYVKEVQNAVDAYAKTVYWAEVCYGPGRNMKVRAYNRAIDPRYLAYEARREARKALAEKLRQLFGKHEADQDKYERDTDGGFNQSAVRGKDVEITDTVPLQ